jgi:biopolymer transport protein ExbD
MRRIQSLRLGSSARRREPKIGIAPLIDMVFILLIFFLVTTSFVRETGVTVDKPVAATAETLEKQSVLVAVTGRGAIHINQRQVDIPGLRAALRKTLRSRPGRPVVIIADRNAKTGRVVDVIDTCKLAGAKKVSLASRKK